MRPDITDQGASAHQPASPVEGNSSASMDRFFLELAELSLRYQVVVTHILVRGTDETLYDANSNRPGILRGSFPKTFTAGEDA